jgi:hypothetical protein
MARDDSFTYGSETVGGASATHSTEILNHYMFRTGEDDAQFVVRFSLNVPNGTPTAVYTAMQTARQSLESNLRMRYQRLQINWGGVYQEIFDPNVSAGTLPSSGFDQEPELSKLSADEFPQSGNSQAYEFRVRCGRPPNYTDAFGAANGRRQVDANLHYDVNEQLVVTMTGEWTQVPSALARDEFLAIFDGSTGYANYRLGLIDTSDGQSNTWTLTRREESDPNSLALLRFVREYSQHQYGRRGSAYSIRYTESGQRIVTIQGTYLRTYTGSEFGTAAASTVNYGDGTNGGQAYAVTQLAALTTAQGGTLVVGQTCELIGVPIVRTNQQDDRTDYTLVYRELLFKQSSSGNFLDDPNVVNDAVLFKSFFVPTADSPTPGDAAAQPPPQNYIANQVPSAFAAAPQLSAMGVVAGILPANSAGLAASTPATKPVSIGIFYEAFIKKTVPDLRAYWDSFLLGYLVSTTSGILGYSGGELVTYEFSAEETTWKITGAVVMRAYTSPVVSFLFTLGQSDDLGLRVDAAFTGTPHEYLVQQALPKSFMSRRVEAVYLTNGNFSLDQFVSPPVTQGWVKLLNAKPDTRSVVQGIPSQGVPQIQLTRAVLEESFVWVARNVAQGSNASPMPASNPANNPSASPAFTALGDTVSS